MNATSQFQAGQLNDALATQLAEVKKDATNLNARFFLAELCCFVGDWERADRQLDVIVKHPDNATMRAQLLRQLIRTEVLREQVVREGRSPELVVALPRDAELQLELCAAIRAGQTEDYAGLIESAIAAQAAVTGTCNGEPFEGIQDLDDRYRGTSRLPRLVVSIFGCRGRRFAC